MKQKYLIIIMVVLALLALAACGGEEPTEVPTEVPAEAPAEEPTEAPVEEPVVELFGDPLRGGLLYDKWWKITGADAPEDDHPLWATQSTNERSGDDTWRCKECHGWDYSGVDGAYGSGSHMTGFTGIIDLAGAPGADILAMLQGSTNADHDFASILDEQALTDLALFVSEEMVDTALFVNDDKTPVSSDVALGEELFLDCADCHGPEGLAVNFHTTVDDPEYVSGLAAGNPWEFIHKISFGQPSTEMLSTLDAGWTVEEQAALLAYAQTLPDFPDVSSGGLLYDKWWAALDLEKPTDDQPLWATQNTNERSGADTWRCKECHGWDYAGVDGAYGSGSHMTGFTGLQATTGMSADELMGWLNGTANVDHDFSSFVDEAAMQLLVTFMQEGIFDMTPYINADKSVNGDAGAGEGIFSQGCVRCHGDDGKAINFGDESDPEYLGAIATGNPWEFLHKATNGQPGSHMTQGREMGWRVEDLVNLLSYAQTLPAE